MNIIMEPREMFGSRRGNFIRENMRAIIKKRKGMAIEATPKYWLKNWLYWVGIGPDQRKDITDITVRIMKNTKRIV
jgi:hypothetical protein